MGDSRRYGSSARASCQLYDEYMEFPWSSTVRVHGILMVIHRMSTYMEFPWSSIVRVHGIPVVINRTSTWNSRGHQPYEYMEFPWSSTARVHGIPMVINRTSTWNLHGRQLHEFNGISKLSSILRAHRIHIFVNISCFVDSAQLVMDQSRHQADASRTL